MATPHNAPYKKEQRRAKKMRQSPGKVLWVSNVIESVPFGRPRKRRVQGTYIQTVHGKLK